MSSVESAVYRQRKKIGIEKKVLKILKSLKTIESDLQDGQLSFEEGAQNIKNEIDIILSISNQAESKK